jgi:CCR4-NOT transcription complex subunit 1
MKPSSDPIFMRQLQKWLQDLRTLSQSKEEQKIAGAGGAAVGGVQQQMPGAPNSAAPTPAPSSRETVTFLLDNWMRVSMSMPNDQVFGQYLQLMHQYGVVKTEDAADRFFRMATDICAEACIKSATATTSNNDGNANLNFNVIDALSKLFLLLIRLADKEATDMSVRVNLLNRILNAIAKSIIDDHEQKKDAIVNAVQSPGFDQRPYFRLLSNLMADLGTPDPKQEPNIQLLPLLSAYATVYHVVQPYAVPGFAFAWLQLVSHRCFLPNLMMLPNQKGWQLMHKLLLCQLIFLQPFLKAGRLNEPLRKVYRGTLRVLLVLLHDFPEFLCDFHLTLCDHIPATCIQMRNLILSAFPRNMRLPDPFTPNLKVDHLPEISQPPRIFAEYTNIVLDRDPQLRGFREHLATFLGNRNATEATPFAASIPPLMMVAGNPGSHNIPFITAFIVHTGTLVNQQQQPGMPPLLQSPAFLMIKHLMKILQPEGRYTLLNAIANQLRYPNIHTHYFSCLLLALFMDSDEEIVCEQITRVLLERLIVHRPHPWGLLITFIELIKNPSYNFWRRPFTRCAPEIERVLESVARSCINQPPGGGGGNLTAGVAAAASA